MNTKDIEQTNSQIVKGVDKDSGMQYLSLAYTGELSTYTCHS